MLAYARSLEVPVHVLINQLRKETANSLDNDSKKDQFFQLIAKAGSQQTDTIQGVTIGEIASVSYCAYDTAFSDIGCQDLAWSCYNNMRLYTWNNHLNEQEHASVGAYFNSVLQGAGDQKVKVNKDQLTAFMSDDYNTLVDRMENLKLALKAENKALKASISAVMAPEPVVALNMVQSKSVSQKKVTNTDKKKEEITAAHVGGNCADADRMRGDSRDSKKNDVTSPKHTKEHTAASAEWPPQWGKYDKHLTYDYASFAKKSND